MGAPYVAREDDFMKRIMLKVAYDGANYCGWQIQPTGLTVEEVLNDKLSALLHEEIHVLGVSRTDSGVHALGNLCVFDTESQIPAEKMAFALNQSLPDDIVIQSSCEVPEGFHPRKCDSVKTYEYVIYNGKVPDPTRSRYTHFFYQPLNVEAMRKAAAYLVGEHDFKSFCSAHSDKENTVRTLTGIEIEISEIQQKIVTPQEKIVTSQEKIVKTGEIEGEIQEKIVKSFRDAGDTPYEPGLRPARIITIRVSGTGFLYNMVRIIVGTLLRIGTGFWEPEKMAEILDAKDRNAAGPKAPACGLTLMGIRFL